MLTRSRRNVAGGGAGVAEDDAPGGARAREGSAGMRRVAAEAVATQESTEVGCSTGASLLRWCTPANCDGRVLRCTKKLNEDLRR